MSTDFDVVCDRCRKVRHLGQRMAVDISFGFGSNDLRGSADAALWVYRHLTECGPLRVVLSSTEFSEEYQYVHDEVPLR